MVCHIGATMLRSHDQQNATYFILVTLLLSNDFAHRINELLTKTIPSVAF